MWSFLPFSFIPLPLIPHYYPLIVPFHQSNFSTSSPIIITLPSVWLSLFYKPSLSLSLSSHLLIFSPSHSFLFNYPLSFSPYSSSPWTTAKTIPSKSPKNSSSLEVDFISFDFFESESSIHICSERSRPSKRKILKTSFLSSWSSGRKWSSQVLGCYI